MGRPSVTEIYEDAQEIRSLPVKLNSGPTGDPECTVRHPGRQKETEQFRTKGGSSTEIH